MSAYGTETSRGWSSGSVDFSGWRSGPSESQVLLVDDEPRQLRWMKGLLEEKGYRAETAEDGEQACRMLASHPFSVLITDLKMPGKSGIEVMQQMKRVQPGCLGIVVTGFGSIEESVEAMRAGAYDFLPKPLEPQQVLKVIEEGVRLQKLRANRGWGDASGEFIVGSSSKMLRVREIVDRVAGADSTVLILGESGTGKELVAKTLHHLSPRSSKPFVVVHCGAIPETLLESELFGHERGAFTGAFKSRIGRLEMANGGTLFLDEVGDIPLHLQLKLLRVLQDRKFERVGGMKTICADFRVVAATNKDLEREVAEGRFRLDLFYRLNVIPVTLPPLRERKKDIQLLSNYFLGNFNKARGGSIEGFSPEAARLLTDYHWPGNVRELKNLMERLAVLKDSGPITPEDLPESFHTLRASGAVSAPSIPEEGVCLNSLLEEFENRLLMEAIKKSNGVKNRAAKLLGIKRTTLVEKIKKRGLEGTDLRSPGLSA